MKNNILKCYIVLAFFLSSAMLFAQGPGEDDIDGTMEETANDSTGLPIDDYVLVLGIAGLALVFMTMRAYNKQENKLLK